MSLLRKGAIHPIRGFADYALSFDGINDYVSVLNDDSLNPSEITIEFWVKADLSKLVSPTLRYDLINKGVDNYAINQLRQDIGAGVLRFYCNINNRRFYISYPWGTLQDGVWTFIALTCNGTTLNTWVNTNQKSTTDYISVSRDTISNLILACTSPPTANYYLYGLIDEVRIYNRALTPAEIQRNMYAKTPLLDGLVLWLPMNEGRGDMVYDKSGQNNNGTITGATWARR